ncbi:MAG: phosphoethanolamine--lipid A transferase [Magnetococcales bacterium]|nr:phosphoethanolamine--lipid A transferase [Magnetococcales bacterium]
MKRIILSDVAMAGMFALFLLLFGNQRLWWEAWHLVDLTGGDRLLFLASMWVVLWLLFTGVLLLVTWPHVFKPVLLLLLLIATPVAYFMDTLGVHINREMIRNAQQTDWREVLDLLTPGLGWHLLVYGIIPAIGVIHLPVRYSLTPRQILRKGLLVLGGTLVAIGIILALYPSYASFFRNHHEIRQLINPSNSLYAVSSYVNRWRKSLNQELVAIGEDVRMRSPAGGRPRLVVVVVGETARADHFQLGGYARPTTPQLSQRELFYFTRVLSCGTDTAVSVPCMFSDLSRSDYDADLARHRENLLDTVQRAGVRVVWLENQSGCKGVCDRITTRDLSRANDPELCRDGVCQDEILSKTLQQVLNEPVRSTLVVLHQMGSHGPAYYKRYPKQFEQFQPVCRTRELSGCSAEALINSYDNTILYTDHVLSETIRVLEQHQQRYDAALYYVSDHGESLGENNLYLHGAPYLIAPMAQKHVPMVIWLSPGFQQSASADRACLASRRTEALSHHNLFATVLGMLDLETRVYRPELDVLHACRR